VYNQPAQQVPFACFADSSFSHSNPFDETRREKTWRTHTFDLFFASMNFNTRYLLTGLANVAAVCVVIGLVSHSFSTDESSTAEPLAIEAQLPVVGVAGLAPRRKLKGGMSSKGGMSAKGKGSAAVCTPVGTPLPMSKGMNSAPVRFRCVKVGDRL
jgi:hypothetical protein